MMMSYHLAYDLSDYYGWNINVYSGGWKLLEQSCATLFLLLTGFCFVLSQKRSRSWKKYFRRGLKILAYGFVVSIATYLFDSETYVRFGILHLIGISTMLLPFFAPLKTLNVIIGMLIITCGAFIRSGTSSSELLLPFGLTPLGFMTIDYFPMLPWFGVVLIGVAMGYAFHSKIPLHAEEKSRTQSAIKWISAHSLVIYMVHQPIFLALLSVLNR